MMPVSFQMIVRSRIEMWNRKYKPQNIYTTYSKSDPFVLHNCLSHSEAYSPQSSEPLGCIYPAHIHPEQVPCNTAGRCACVCRDAWVHREVGVSGLWWAGLPVCVGVQGDAWVGMVGRWWASGRACTGG